MSPYSHPDDSSLVEVSTLPRGQVDYLSHDWIEEEDVWRSWRNMTKQKKEIANGIRLENASWRTWWKQRNKLKTVTPETLNWLKDSDVTWLYGPLHTAVVWTPPPQPKPDPTSVEKDKSAHDRLDLSVHSPGYHKPILKHRSISEMLTSDLLPGSPLFSPAGAAPINLATSSRNHSPLSDELGVIAEEDGDNEVDHQRLPQKPSLSRARSEAHAVPARPYSATNLSGYFSAHMSAHPSRGPRGGSPNTDVMASAESIPVQETTPGSGSSTPGTMTPATGGKKKHITFNTFVEQCIAIDKPEAGVIPPAASSSSSLSQYDHVSQVNGRGVMGGRSGKTSAKGVKWGYGTVYDEDSSDGYDSDAPVPELGADPEERSSPVWNGVESAIESDSDDEPPQIQLKRSTSSNSLNSTTTKRQKRSASKSSNSSTSTSSGSSSGSSVAAPPPPPRSRRNSSHQLLIEHSLVPPVATKKRHRRDTKRQSSLPVQPVHVTIAPIAPTILKTSGVGNGWAGDGYNYSAYGGGSLYGTGARTYGPAVFSDDDDGDDDPGVVIGRVVHPPAHSNPEVHHEGTPVELVYVPPVGSQYAQREASEEEDESSDGDDEDPETVYHYYSPQGSSGDLQAVNGGAETIPVAVARTPPPASNLGTNPTAPIIDDAVFAEDTESAYDYFEGPDLGSGVDFARRTRKHGGRPRGEPPVEVVPPTESQKDGGLRLGLGPALQRYSQGGPSPPVAVSPPLTTKSTLVAKVSQRGRVTSPRATSPSTSPPSRSNSSSLLSPPTRGRGPNPVADRSSSPQSRGRSSTRTSSTSNSFSRERSSHSSSIGSLSPDGGPTYGVYGASTGRVVRDKETKEERRDRKVREQQRRSVSASPDDGEADQASSSLESSVEWNLNSSSSSSTATIIPISQAHIPMTIPQTPPAPPAESAAVPIRTKSEEESRRSLHPTPANSPEVNIAPIKQKSSSQHTQLNGIPSSSKRHMPLSPSPVSISMPREGAEAALAKASSTSAKKHQPRRSMNEPSSPQKELGEGGTISRAVGIANAFLGLWSGNANGLNTTSTTDTSS